MVKNAENTGERGVAHNIMLFASRSREGRARRGQKEYGACAQAMEKAAATARNVRRHTTFCRYASSMSFARNAVWRNMRVHERYTEKKALS